MESYYSSDEEIAWGPVTVRELKGDLKRLPIKKPNRRHTVVCKIQNPKMDDSLIKEINKIDVSGTSTAYYTPNESLKTSNSDFLEKLTNVINVPSSELSEYVSILNDTDNTANKSENTDSQIVPLVVPNIFITDMDDPNHNNSCINFIKALENRETQYDIENFQQTLVENSYVMSEDEEIITNVTKSESEEDEVIVLSDDTEDSISSVEDFGNVSCDKITSFKKETEFDFHSECESEKTENKRELQEYNSESTSMDETEEQCEDVEDNCIGNRFNEDNIDNKETTHQDTEQNFIYTPNRQEKLSTIEESISTSPVIVPDIDLAQFDDSVEDNTNLNDTLEEMNKLLSQGLNYTMSDDEVVENTPIKQNLIPEQLITPSNQTTSHKQSSSSSREKPSHIPRLKCIPTSSEKKGNTYVVKKSPPKSTPFKVPQPRTKLFNPTPPKSHPNLKDIVSPVALYIKNSPRFPLVQNVPLREVPRVVFTKSSKSSKSSNKENFDEFPEVVYKPSKKQVVSTKKPIVIPSYMSELNIVESHITKHEGRIHHKVEESKVSEKLLQSNLTRDSIDQSLLDRTADISVLTNKQAFIK